MFVKIKINVMKNLIRSSFFLLTAMLAQSCSGGGVAVVFFIIALILIVMAINASNNAKEKDERRRENARLRAVAEKIAKEKKEETYKEEYAKILAEWGEADKTIRIVDFDINQEIRAYSKHNKVVILGKEYDFVSIIQCQLTDDTSVEKGQTTITSQGTTKTNTGNMVGRAVVGGVLAGGAGAIIGSTTASKDTTSTSVVKQSADITRHDYTIWITVKDIANPMIQIHIGRNGTKANEVVALMNAILQVR